MYWIAISVITVLEERVITIWNIKNVFYHGLTMTLCQFCWLPVRFCKARLAILSPLFMETDINTAHQQTKFPLWSILCCWAIFIPCFYNSYLCSQRIVHWFSKLSEVWCADYAYWLFHLNKSDSRTKSGGKPLRALSFDAWHVFCSSNEPLQDHSIMVKEPF